MIDKKGKTIKEWDLLKIYHFTGARRKKYYMYKWIKKDLQTGDLMGYSLNHTGHYFNLYSIAKNGIIKDGEIVQRGGPLETTNEDDL